MATVAGGRRVHVVVVHVALQARDCGVGAGERIVGIKRMVEFRIEPIDRGVAGGAIVGQAKLHMRRILCASEIGGVAGVTCGRRALENVIRMTCRARQGRMCSGQRVAGQCQVIEFRIKPGVYGVARLAGCGESS